MFTRSTAAAKDLWKNTRNKKMALSGCKITLRGLCFFVAGYDLLCFLSYIYACYAKCTKIKDIFFNMTNEEFWETVLILFVLLNYNKSV